VKGKPSLGPVIITSHPSPKSDADETGTPSYDKIKEKEGVDAVTGFFPEVMERIISSCTRLSPNLKLSEFSKHIESVNWIMKYKDCAEANRTYASAQLNALVQEDAVKVSLSPARWS
jgi:hypothetical protein